MNNLPHLDEAVIPQEKITHYLLSSAHSSGRDKAVFFESCGFTLASWEGLAHALRQHATQHEIVQIEISPFGKRYVIEGILQTPGGKTPKVRAVWFIETSEVIPRFVTAYPLKGN